MNEKVLCPWCGEEMECHNNLSSIRYHCFHCGAVAPFGEMKTHESAYQAAMRRPPNKPMTKEQLYALPNDAAIWVCYNDGVRREGAFPTSASWGKFYPDLCCDNGMAFSSLPTNADIEAARRGLT